MNKIAELSVVKKTQWSRQEKPSYFPKSTSLVQLMEETAAELETDLTKEGERVYVGNGARVILETNPCFSFAFPETDGTLKEKYSHPLLGTLGRRDVLLLPSIEHKFAIYICNNTKLVQIDIID